MSTPAGNPRRRRIAGERRGRALSVDQLPSTEQPVGPSASAAPPVVLDERARPAAEPADEVGRHEVARHEVARHEVARHEAQLHEAGATAAPAERSPGWGSRLTVTVLGALLALILLLTGLAALGLLGTDGVEDVQETEAVDRARRTAPAAGEAAAAAILAYDHRSLDADQENAAGFMTDEFAEEYSSTFEKVVRPAAEQNRAEVTATVLASSVLGATENSARVLLFVDQATVSRVNERPQIALNRVVMTMQREGDSWLVSDISSY